VFPFNAQPGSTVAISRLFVERYNYRIGIIDEPDFGYRINGCNESAVE
jgi:hypothetical protein